MKWPLTLLFAGAISLSAQDVAHSPAQSAAPEPVLKQNPLELLRQFEAPANQEYELGPGDEIAIDAAGRPELSAHHVLGPDGRITLPLAGDVELNNKTRKEAAAAIDAALAPYYSQVSATVSVEKYTANRVLVLGAVEHPGVVQFDGQPTLLEAITRSGLPGAQHAAAPSQVLTLSPASSLSAIPERCAIYRGNEQVAWVELRKLLSSGNTMADLRLRRGDVVFVPNEQQNYVSVLGEVQHPGPVQLSPDMTLASALALAGGLTEKAGLSSRIEIVQPSTGKTTYIPFRSVLSVQGNAAEIELHAGDVIFVPQTGFYKVTNAINQFNPLTSLFTLTMLAYH